MSLCPLYLLQNNEESNEYNKVVVIKAEYDDLTFLSVACHATLDSRGGTVARRAKTSNQHSG